MCCGTPGYTTACRNAEKCCVYRKQSDQTLLQTLRNLKLCAPSNPTILPLHLIIVHHVCRLERRWIEVTADTQVDALLDAVKCGLKSGIQDSDIAPKRTMVFTNTVDAANSVFDILQHVNIPCVLYHRETPMEERAKKIAALSRKRRCACLHGCSIPWT
jgi:hypothetical protein